MKSKTPALVVLAALAMFSGPSWGYDIDLGPLGHACDTCGGGVVGGLPVIGHALNEAQAQASGVALEQWFIASRNSSVGGAMPIPAYIQQQLEGFSNPDAMARVRYRIQDNGALNLAHIIQQWRLRDVTAVTLIDVVIFRGPTEAADPCLWAHELIHVEQFRDWGSRDFSIRYMRDSNSAEDPAYAKERECRSGLLPVSRPFPTAQPFPPFPNGLPQMFPGPQMGAFCLTPLGRFGPGPVQAVGTPCNITAPGGLVWGQVGF